MTALSVGADVPMFMNDRGMKMIVKSDLLYVLLGMRDPSL